MGVWRTRQQWRRVLHRGLLYSCRRQPAYERLAQLRDTAVCLAISNADGSACDADSNANTGFAYANRDNTSGFAYTDTIGDPASADAKAAANTVPSAVTASE